MRNKWLSYGLLAAIALIVLWMMMSDSSQSTNQNVGSDRPTASASPTRRPPTLAPAVKDVFCERPYQAASIWNVPLDWSVARVHPMSDQMMAAFFEDSSWIGSDASQYAPNIYLASNETALVPVKLRENRFRDAINDIALTFGERAGTVWLPLPPEAQPAPGTDGQLVVVNQDTGEEWGLNEGFVDAEGNWSAGGVYRYSIENSGIPPEGFGQRGAGIGQLAGIVRRCEVERDRIEHALTLAYDHPCAPVVCQQSGWPASIPPFRKTDGEGTSPFDIPEGARLAIRPEISKAQIEAACGEIKGCLVWTLAMQEYGGFLVDRSGHPKTYAEGNASANWDASLWTDDMLRDIPADWYVVIDWNTPSAKGLQ